MHSSRRSNEVPLRVPGLAGASRRGVPVIDDRGGRIRYPVSSQTGVPVTGHRDDEMDTGPLREPWKIVQGHKVYRKEACTLDHKPVAARRYFGLWQCSCCHGIIAPALRKLRVLRLGAHVIEETHVNGRAA